MKVQLNAAFKSVEKHDPDAMDMPEKLNEKTRVSGMYWDSQLKEIAMNTVTEMLSIERPSKTGDRFLVSVLFHILH